MMILYSVHSAFEETYFPRITYSRSAISNRKGIFPK